MEKQLFDWEGWDDVDVACYQFYKVKLKVKIGNFEPNTEFDSAMVDYQKGLLCLYLKEESYDFHLTLNVVQTI